jgi:hypothetical protein
MEAVEFVTLEWVDWFDNHCLLEPIGNLPPAEPKLTTTPCWTTCPWPHSTQANTPPANPARFSQRRAGRADDDGRHAGRRQRPHHGAADSAAADAGGRLVTGVMLAASVAFFVL